MRRSKFTEEQIAMALRRLALSVMLASVVILGSLAIGVLGYRTFEGLS